MVLNSILENGRDNIVYETELDTVKRQLVEDAKQLAVLGEVDAARDLISLLFTKSPSSTRGTVPPLVWAWKETAQWPNKCSPPSNLETTYEKLRKEWEEDYWGTGWVAVSSDDRTFDERGLQACLVLPERAIHAGYLDESTRWMAMEKSARWVKALDISFRLSEVAGSDEGHSRTEEEASTEDEWEAIPAVDKRTLEILQQVVDRWDANQQVDYMCMAERLWPMYISGMVAKAMGLDKQALKSKAANIIKAYGTRLSSPFASTQLANKSIKEILEIGSENTVRGAGKESWDEMDNPSQTLFHTPVSGENIADLEKRLEVTLPDDFKEFLQVSNGFGANGDGTFNGYFTDPEIYGTDEVRWNNEEYFQLPVDLLNIHREIEALAGIESKGHFSFDTALPLFGPVLEIGVRDVEHLWLVQPTLVRQAREAYDRMYARTNEEQKRTLDDAIVAFAGSRDAFDKLEWCCARWSSGGAAVMTSYASFRRYLEVVVTDSMEVK
ncbi:uncharacterized protein LTR77_004385 [Saxophila tyrrhenica]|uniref:Knr4/Smi1-like domain-containing protein n=1 Tax=Saxophila tyrrhenica TaxID=1690608 RepID=A0AAV9PD00_9PEZI|nr:hypothetical protein LTR77_004385 [Saxophila tyrrhenica]